MNQKRTMLLYRGMQVAMVLFLVFNIFGIFMGSRPWLSGSSAAVNLACLLVLESSRKTVKARLSLLNRQEAMHDSFKKLYAKPSNVIEIDFDQVEIRALAHAKRERKKQFKQ